MTHVYVVVTSFIHRRVLGVYATAERAVGAHDGLWMEAKDRDEDGRRSWVNQRSLTWSADPGAPARIVEYEVRA